MARKRAAKKAAPATDKKSTGKKPLAPANELARSSLASLPLGYRELLEDVKNRVRAAQLKGAVAVNRELIQLYWDIGCLIVERQKREGWGKAVIERLADDVQRAFPGLRGFSRSNVFRMRAFFKAYSAVVELVPQAVGQLNRKNVAQPVRPLAQEKVAQAVRLTDGPLLPPALAGVPWGHNIVLLQKLRENPERLWYARQTLGTGFSFVGRQFPIAVGNDDFYLDLLFYHLKLRCFVVIDLKMQKFTPEDAGKLNFYLSAVDSQLRHPDDKPAIGLVLCKTRDRVIAEYALRDINKPIGVAEWQTKLVQSLPKNLRGNLPTIEQIEEELGGVR